MPPVKSPSRSGDGGGRDVRIPRVIPRTDGTSRTVLCLTVGPFWVHACIDGDGFALTHSGTGLVAARLPREKDCVRLAGLLNNMGDWSVVRKGPAPTYMPIGGGELRARAVKVVRLATAGKWDEAERLYGDSLLFG